MHFKLISKVVKLSPMASAKCLWCGGYSIWADRHTYSTRALISHFGWEVRPSKSIYLQLTLSPIEQLEMSYGQWWRWYPAYNVHPGTLDRREAGLLGGCYFDTLISMLVGSQNQLEMCDLCHSYQCISRMYSYAFSSVSNPISTQMTLSML